MAYKDDLKLALGFPQIKVELSEISGKDDFALIEARVLRLIRPYFPKEYILRKPVPSNNANGYGTGAIDLTTDDVMNVSDVYIIRAATGQNDVLLPWSTIRIWEQAWLGKSEFLGTDLLLYQNEVALLNQVTNYKFGWKYDQVDKKLYVTNIPSYSTGIGITTMKGIDHLDDLDKKDIVYEYALRMGVALGKQKIGALWRKYNVMGLEMPGPEVVQEGYQEAKDVQDEINSNSYYPGGLH